MGKKSGSQTASTTSAPPPQVMAQYSHVMDLANQQAGQPLQQYTEQRVADLSPSQQQAIANAASQQGTATPYYNAAAQSYGNAQNPLMPNGVNMTGMGGSPYSFNPATRAMAQLSGTGMRSLSDLASSYLDPSQLAGAQLNLGSLSAPSFDPALSAAQGITAAGQPAFSSALNLAGSLPTAANAGIGTAMGGLGAAYQAASGANPNLTLNQGDLSAARGFAGDDVFGGLPQFNQSTINQYLNPYQNDVMQASLANIDEENAQEQQRLMGQSIMSGASPFGGDRAGVAAANLARQQGLARNSAIAGLNQQGYSQALDQYNKDKSLQAQTTLAQNQQGATTALNLAQLQQQAGLGAAQLGVNAGGLGVQAGLGAGDLTQKGVAQAGQLTAQVGQQQTQAAAQQAQAMRDAIAAQASAQASAFGLNQQGDLQRAGLAQAGTLAAQGLNQGASQQAASLGFNQFNTQQQQQLAQQQLQLAANQGQAGLALQAGQGMANLGTAAQQSNILDLNALLGTGALSQQQQQNLLNVPYQDFLQQQAFPYQNISWLSDISTGLGSGMGGTSTSTTPTAGWGQQAAGLGMAALPFLMKRGGRVPGLGASHHAMGGFDDDDDDEDDIPDAPPSAFEDPFEVIGGEGVDEMSGGDEAPSPGLGAARVRQPFHSNIPAPTAPSGKPDWREAVAMAGLGMASSRSPQFGQALAEGAMGGLRNWSGQKALQRKEEQDYHKAVTDKAKSDTAAEHYYNLDQKPQVDHSGDTVRFIYNDGQVMDTGIPTVASRRAKQEADYQKGLLGARGADAKERGRHNQAMEDSGKYSWTNALDDKGNIIGAHRMNAKTGEREFQPDVRLGGSGKGGAGGFNGAAKYKHDVWLAAHPGDEAGAVEAALGKRTVSPLEINKWAATQARGELKDQWQKPKDEKAWLDSKTAEWAARVRSGEVNAQPGTSAAKDSPTLPPRDKLVKGETYMTKRGKGKWMGDHFELVGP